MARDRATIKIEPPRKAVPLPPPRPQPVYRASSRQQAMHDHGRVPTRAMPRYVNWEDIVWAVVSHYDITAEDFFSERRHPTVVRARRAYVWLCRRLTRYSFPEIARFANRPTHSTSLSQHKIAAHEYASNPAYKGELDTLELRIKQHQATPPSPLVAPTSTPGGSRKPSF